MARSSSPSPQPHASGRPISSPPLEEGSRRRVSRKLQKNRKSDTFSTTMDLPDRLKGGDESDDEEDLVPAQGPSMLMHMNQSIFGLIAAAGSRVNFHDRFEGQSSDDEDDPDDPSRLSAAPLHHRHRPDRSDRHMGPHHRRHRSGPDDTHTSTAQSALLGGAPGPHRRPSSRSRARQKLARTLAALPRLPEKVTRQSKQSSQQQQSESPSDDTNESFHSDAQASSSAASSQAGDHPPRRAPVMSRMLEARADRSLRPSFDHDRPPEDEDGSDETSASDLGVDTKPSPLAIRLAQIFEFSEPEEVIEEYPCWLLQTVLLQGYMYITAKHVCFYAYLPKKANEVVKSGYLSKSGKRNPKYNRYWFRLKGDVLAYYREPSNLYFPSGQIDLRYGISASITDKNKDGLHFTVTTSNRTYYFRADSAPSAKEWVESLQRVIFRSHNDGDSVKISLPIDNIIDIEDTQMLQFADTCKIRVIDNDETFAIDEYFFSFFSFGKEAISVLRILFEDASARQKEVVTRVEAVDDAASETTTTTTSGQSAGRPSSMTKRRGRIPHKIRTARLPEAVKATLSPMAPASPNAARPGASQDGSRGGLDTLRSSPDVFRGLRRRRSTDMSSVSRDRSPRTFSGHRSASMHRLGDVPASPSPHPDKHEYSDSFARSSTEDPSYSALAASSVEDPSASQILRRSDVFQNPTVGRSDSPSGEDRGRRPPLAQQHKSASSPALPPTTLATYAGQQHPEASAAPSLHTITYPLQRVGAFAEYLNRSGRRMSSLIAAESMGYVEKVSGMWKGGRKHYDAPAEMREEDEDLYEDGEGNVQQSTERFRAHFALPETEKLQATYFGFLFRVLPLYGKLYLSDRSLCFRSLLPGTRTKLILPLKDVENVHKEKGFRFGYSGLCVVIRGHEELFFEFNQQDVRDDCFGALLKSIERFRFLDGAGTIGHADRQDAACALAERQALKEARQEEFPDHEIQLPRQTTSDCRDAPTILYDDPKDSLLRYKPPRPLRITCLTIGSRGDVQPYIALAKGLLAEGHQVRIATHAEFRGWVEGHGVEFAEVDGDPAELMRLCIENGVFTWSFLREANSTFRGWLDDLLQSAWRACQGSDLLIESPSVMAGIHIAEALGIPFFRAFTMPWTRTRAYPHAFVMGEYRMGGAYNYMTYVMFDNIFWKATAGQINRWRNSALGLPSTSLEKMQPNKVPFLYNFSPSVVAPPLDYSDWIRVTGYWFLDEGADYQPPRDLADFIAKARAEGKKLVYVGFGSIIVNDVAKMTQDVIDAVLKADVRCVLSKGWSDRLTKDEPRPQDDGKGDDGTGDGSDAMSGPTAGRRKEPDIPEEIFVIKSAPHDWLFRQMDAAAHHGGSGTTGASLRAGIPTIIRPFFGDQFFFGGRVEDLGVGICLKKWGAMTFGRALWEATHNERMIVKARVLGEQIRKENGVETAIQFIYRDLEYAHGLIQRKAGKNKTAAEKTEVDGGADASEAEEEESWTFIGDDEPDPEMVTKRLSEMHGAGGGDGPEVGAVALGSRTKALGSRVLSGSSGFAGA
ncbi:glycosyltransferase family 1 protein [Sodiomyces alcalophilus JCM 7366]|uniref:glycosyltransferase family 1 protein n=1 Tax=Sodiomyces alcalophilus JCM 7366 TaxID=591952 RepID=UPI0039B538B8